MKLHWICNIWKFHLLHFTICLKEEHNMICQKETFPPGKRSISYESNWLFPCINTIYWGKKAIFLTSVMSEAWRNIKAEEETGNKSQAGKHRHSSNLLEKKTKHVNICIFYFAIIWIFLYRKECSVQPRSI